MSTWYERVIAAHRAVTDAVSHAVRLKSDRYFVWQEDGGHDLPGDNGHGETAVTGTTDLFTKSEFDPWVEQLGEVHVFDDEACGAGLHRLINFLAACIVAEDDDPCVAKLLAEGADRFDAA